MTTTHDGASYRPLDQLRAVRDLPKASATEKLVLTALILRSNASGECWPSYQRIASDTSLDRRTVQRTVQTLVTKRHVSVRRRRVEGSSESDCNTYTVAALDHQVVADDHHVAAQDHGGGGTTPLQVAAHDHQGGDPMPPDLPRYLPNGTAQVSEPGSGEPVPLQLVVVDEAKQKKPKAPKREATPEHREGIAYFRELFVRLRGCEPEIFPKDHVAMNRLLENGRTVADVKAILDRAFATDFVRTSKPDLSYIASAINAYIGTAPVKATRPGALVQRDTDWTG